MISPPISSAVLWLVAFGDTRSFFCNICILKLERTSGAN